MPVNRSNMFTPVVRAIGWIIESLELTWNRLKQHLQKKSIVLVMISAGFAWEFSGKIGIKLCQVLDGPQTRTPMHSNLVMWMKGLPGIMNGKSCHTLDDDKNNYNNKNNNNKKWNAWCPCFQSSIWISHIFIRCFFPGPAPFALSILGQGWGVSGVANCEFLDRCSAENFHMSNEKTLGALVV